jgi:hypothetical protein
VRYLVCHNSMMSFWYPGLYVECVEGLWVGGDVWGWDV